MALLAYSHDVMHTVCHLNYPDHRGVIILEGEHEEDKQGQLNLCLVSIEEVTAKGHSKCTSDESVTASACIPWRPSLFAADSEKTLSQRSCLSPQISCFFVLFISIDFGALCLWTVSLGIAYRLS